MLFKTIKIDGSGLPGNGLQSANGLTDRHTHTHTNTENVTSSANMGGKNNNLGLEPHDMNLPDIDVLFSNIHCFHMINSALETCIVNASYMLCEAENLFYSGH